MKKYRAYVISHTHWDREWYQTFQQYRRRLVRLIDGLLDGLEKNPEYKHFHFDGQTILIEDYLRIRPENKERLFNLIRSGRIIIGPWYTMPDEFLVSGESLIYNLQKGIRICEELGVEPMMSGYVTDIFGHNSQFPQILRGFGIDNALLYRGIADFPKDQFMWEAADGSVVNAYKLEKNRSYSNFYFAVRWPFEKLEYSEEDLIKRGKKLVEMFKGSATGNVLLMMDGVDHIDMQENLPQILKLLNENIEDVEFVHATFDEFNAACKENAPELETIKGPLYNIGYEGINNQVLKNVLSSMVQLKQANDRCETKLTKMASPLEALINQHKDKLRPETLEHTMLPYKGYRDLAWSYLLQNQPHDSICGCSVSEVHMDNEYRFRQCEQISDLMIEESLKILSCNVDWDKSDKDGGFLVYNFGQTDCKGVSVITVELPPSLGWDFSLFNSNGEEIDYQLINTETKVKKTAEYNNLIDMQLVNMATIAVFTDIKRFGYTTFTYKSNKNNVLPYGEYCFDECKHPYRMQGTLRSSHNTFDNGVMVLAVNPNGSLNITDKRTGKVYKDVLTFEDGGDYGDGWNYRKPLFDKQFNTACSNCELSVLSDGKYATVLCITHHMILPNHINNTLIRQGTAEKFEIQTIVTIKKDSYRIDFKTRVKNNVECHRLRVLFPTEFKTDFYYSATPFDMQKWPIKKEDTQRFSEIETNVTPSQGITFLSEISNNCALYSKGLYEVEVTDNDSKTIALTLFRAFMSETGTDTRNYADMNMDLCFEYAFDLEPKTPAEAVLLSDGFRCGTVTNPLTEQGQLPKSSSLAVSNGKNVLSTMYVNENNESIFRFVNYDEKAQQQTLILDCPVKKAEIIDFCGNATGQEITVKDNQMVFVLQPHKISTLRVVF